MANLNLEVGNAWEKSRLSPDGKKNGWFVGTFGDGKPPIDGLRGTDQFNIKWYRHPKGQHADSKPTSGEVTISILIEGAFSRWFRNAGTENEDWKQYVLQQPGDYVIWGPDLAHKWEALESSVVLTVRPPDDKNEGNPSGRSEPPVSGEKT